MEIYGGSRFMASPPNRTRERLRRAVRGVLIDTPVFYRHATVPDKKADLIGINVALVLF